MKFGWVAAALTGTGLLAGCANTNIRFTSDGVPHTTPTAGTSYSAAAVNADLRANAFFGVLLLGYVAAGVEDDYVRAGSAGDARKAPPLDPNRSVAVRDCSKPIETPSANLRCE